ncbi:MAG: rhomboid family protein [Ilumatobacteraceae bacterium]|nr:rhomboid family protein [Ilumatobacteraceae bacterium]
MAIEQQPVVTHCYRHPDREAGRFCTRCGRPACSDCLVQAAVGSHCLECAKAARPDIKDRAVLWNARQITLVTYSLIAINVAVFIIVGLADPSTFGLSGSLSSMQARLGLSKTLLQYGGVFRDGSGAISFAPHQWYRLVSSGFLHFGLIHIGFNMLMLYQLGQLLERRLGRFRFAMLYFAALLAGSLGVLVIQPSGAISGGASGAVFGLMAAAAVGLHRQGINIFSTGLGTVLVLNIFLTFTIPGISIGAHVGGAIAGAVLGYLMLAPPHLAPPKWLSYVAPAVVAIGCVVASVIAVG